MWEKYKGLVALVSMIVTMTVTSMVYFLPVTVFAAHEEQHAYERATATQRTLMTQVMNCEAIFKQYGKYTPTEEMICTAARVDLEISTKLIKTRWGN